MRLAAALLLLAGDAQAQTLGPLSASGGAIRTALSQPSFTVQGSTGSGGKTYRFSLLDESFLSGVYTYQVDVDPALGPGTSTATCEAVKEAVITKIKDTSSFPSGTKLEANTLHCGKASAVKARRAALLQANVVTITATPPVPTAAPTTSSPTTAAPSTAAPTTAAPTTSCPDKYGAAACAPFLAEGLCEDDLALDWCRASCGKCNLCMFAEKKACKEREDCKWGKKKKVCKTKKAKSCADLSKKKCKKANDCKWKNKACKNKKPCKLSKKACKESPACKWKNKTCKKAKKAKARSTSALSASSTEEESSESDDSSESED